MKLLFSDGSVLTNPYTPLNDAVDKHGQILSNYFFLDTAFDYIAIGNTILWISL